MRLKRQKCGVQTVVIVKKKGKKRENIERQRCHALYAHTKRFSFEIMIFKEISKEILEENVMH